ncbi:hypothetical protein MBLNU457_7649t1 [Dothideomycetes sp. NU457]
MASSHIDKISFTDAVVSRRSIYMLDKNLPISDTRVKELVNTAMKHVPSAFDSQTTRLVVLLHGDHDQFWDFVWEALLPHLKDEDKKKASRGRIDGFRGAYGTILFYESDPAVKKAQDTYVAYADKLPQWSEHTSAMHQYVLWTGLEAEGCGANLQHYNPLVDAKVQQHWGITTEWELKAQLVFGGRAPGYEKAVRDKKTEGREDGAKFFGLK